MIASSAEEKDKFLLIYSGPSTPAHYSEIHKGRLYHENFLFFLENGLSCGLDSHGSYDIIITLSEYQSGFYHQVISDFIKSSTCNSVRIVVVENKCYDMGNIRDGLMSVDTAAYDYFVVLNCGIIGPFIPAYARTLSYWPRYFVSILSNSVKLTGVALNCDSQKPRTPQAHVQSYLWVTDRSGFAVIRDSSAIYDCAQNWAKHNQTKISGPEYVHMINMYELGLSEAIMAAGYSIRVINQYQHGLIYTKGNSTTQPFNARCTDLFTGDPNSHKALSLFDLMFHKNSRGMNHQVKMYAGMKEV